jgi:hypothetical protein
MHDGELRFFLMNCKPTLNICKWTSDSHWVVDYVLYVIT